MFNLEKYPWVVPVLLVAVGTGWLLNSVGVLPGVNWAYVLGIAALGLVVLLQGLNRFSFVVGAFLEVGALAAYLRQRGYLTFEVQIPGMVIVLGVLMLIAHYAGLPNAPSGEGGPGEEAPKKHRLTDHAARGPGPAPPDR